MRSTTDLQRFQKTHKMYHGEKVAFGTLVQLVLEDAGEDEIMEVIDFCSENWTSCNIKRIRNRGSETRADHGSGTSCMRTR